MHPTSRLKNGEHAAIHRSRLRTLLLLLVASLCSGCELMQWIKEDTQRQRDYNNNYNREQGF